MYFKYEHDNLKLNEFYDVTKDNENTKISNK